MSVLLKLTYRINAITGIIPKGTGQGDSAFYMEEKRTTTC